MKREINIGSRLAGMLFDHFIMTLICVGLGVITIGIGAIFVNLYNNKLILFPLMGILISLTFSVYINKDAINGQSPAKRSMKLQVIDVKTGKTASPIKCLLRNIILPIWIIEIPFILKNPQRRLGDYIAGTIIESYDNKKTSKNAKKTIVLSVFAGMIYIAIVVGIYFITSGKLLNALK